MYTPAARLLLAALAIAPCFGCSGGSPMFEVHHAAMRGGALCIVAETSTVSYDLARGERFTNPRQYLLRYEVRADGSTRFVNMSRLGGALRANRVQTFFISTRGDRILRIYPNIGAAPRNGKAYPHGSIDVLGPGERAGAWHVLALNSQDCFDDDGCGEGTEQYEWLLDDLDRHPAERFPCTLAFWHDPRFMWVEWWRSDDGPRGPVPAVRPLWDALDDADAELTLGGNAHNYERWISQDVSGAIDPEGLTQFVVGTGGRQLNDAGPAPRPAALASFQDDAFGVLELQLRTGSYRWQWHSAPGEPVFHDEGTADCR